MSEPAKITFLKTEIEEAAKKRPAGYLDEVYSLAEIEGENISLAIKDYHFLRDKYAGPTPDQQKAHEPICRGCEWLNQDALKCMHPNCGCPLSSMRVEPWMNLTQCPIQLF